MTDDESKLTVNLTLTASPSTPRVPIVIEKTCRASELREKAADATKIPLASLKLIFRGRLIANDSNTNVVEEYKLENDCVLHCMGKPVAAVADSSNTAAATPASLSTAAAAGSSVSFMPQSATTNIPTPAPSQGGDALQAALNTLRSSNSAATYLTAVSTLEKILSNCVEKPMEAKYRTVKKDNAAFQKRLGGLPGGEACMLACGFALDTQDGAVCYVLVPSPEAWPKLVATKAKVSAAVALAKSAAGTSSAPPAAGGGGFGGASLPQMGAGMPGMGAGVVPPHMQQQMNNLMQNPDALGSMLQNPMVRNMIQNDPRFANNPMMRQSLDALTSNPDMLRQVSSMMSDPAMQAQMQSMMSGGGMGGAGMNNMGMPPSNPAPNVSATNNNNASGSQQQNNNNGQSDQEMTEEEMIAEAIRRSLGGS